MTDDAVDDALAAVAVAEAGHGARTTAHFTKGALDDVSGAHFFPVALRHRKQAQQVFQVALHAGHGTRAAVLTALAPAAKGPLPLALAPGEIAGRRFGYAGAFLATHFSSDIAHFVSPTELHGDTRIGQGEGRAQAGAAVGDDEL